MHHRHPAQRGQGGPTCTTSLLAPARTAPRSPFHFLILLSLPAAAATSAPSAAIAIADASSPSLLLHHHSCPTSTPVTRRIHPCSLTALSKPQHRARARLSPAAKSVVVATPSPSTFPRHSLCVGSPESVEARLRLRFLRRGLHWRSAAVPLLRATMVAAIVASADERSHQVVQSTR